MSFAALRDAKHNKKSYIQPKSNENKLNPSKGDRQAYTFLDYTLPQALEVRVSDVDGRGVYAKSRLTPGTTILKKLPFVHAISTRFLPLYCSKCCLQSTDLEHCIRCKKVYYCSSTCRSEDLNLHQYECSALQQLTTSKEPAIPGEAIRCIARILWKKKLANSAEVKEIESMQSNRASIPPSAYELHTHLAHALMRYIGITSPAGLEGELGISSAAQLVDLISQFTINTFTLSSPSLSPLGVAVSPLVALFNHSCDPNSIVVFPRCSNKSSEPEMRVVALREIQPGEQITTAYLDTTMPRDIRRMELKERYGFDCMCRLCERDWESANIVDPREALWCPQKCGGTCALPTDEVKSSRCIKCRTPLSTTSADIDGIVDAVRVGREGLEKAETLQDTDPKYALKLTSNLIPLLASGGICGSAHPLLALRRLHLSLLLSSTTPEPPKDLEAAKAVQQALDDQVRTAAEIVYGLSITLPEGHPVRGIALSELGKLLTVDEPFPLAQQTASNFPPHGEARLRLAYETLVRSLKELTIGFGRDADGGQVSRQVRNMIVDVEKELTVWVRKAGRGSKV